jgi:hypothetical protein
MIVTIPDPETVRRAAELLSAENRHDTRRRLSVLATEQRDAMRRLRVAVARLTVRQRSTRRRESIDDHARRAMPRASRNESRSGFGTGSPRSTAFTSGQCGSPASIPSRIGDGLTTAARPGCSTRRGTQRAGSKRVATRQRPPCATTSPRCVRGCGCETRPAFVRPRHVHTDPRRLVRPRWSSGHASSASRSHAHATTSSARSGSSLSRRIPIAVVIPRSSSR